MQFFTTNKQFKMMRLLESLYSDPYASQYELAVKVGIVPGLVNRYIKEQQECNHVRVVSENQRVKSYHLTEQGVKQLLILKHEYYKEIIDMHLELEEEVRRYLRRAAVPEKIVLFGANSIASIISGMPEYEVLYVLDNDTRFHGKKWLGYDVYPIEEGLVDGKTVIICSYTHSKEMVDQLRNMQESNPALCIRFIQLN
jgi:DNA-binding MarR family transcriptional regulator